MRSVSRGSVSGFAVIFSTMALASAAQAGGFAVREQSASFQGMSFAGIGTAYDLSSMYWNPAAAGVAGTAVTFESHIALVFPDAHLSGEGSFEPAPGVSIPLVGDGSTEFGKDGVVAASYGAYRLNDKTVLAMSINAPFGLSTKPEDGAWEGNFQGRRSTIFTLNAAPTITYEVMPGLHVGAGVQVEYFRLKFLFGANPGTLTLPTFTNAEIDIDDYGVGATAGVLWQPAPGTSIGLGFRSSIDHDLEGEFFTGRLGSSGGVEANFETPEIVTLGIQHAITPQMRALGTIEWTNWSRLDAVPIVGSGAVLGPLTGDANDRVLEAHWHDGWFYSVGLEYDYSPKLTLRGGVAYEDSPIENADERLPQVPDSDRVWLSAGLTYRYSETTSFDFGYTHIFFDDAPIEREALSSSAFVLRGEADQSADIVAISVKQKDALGWLFGN